MKIEKHPCSPLDNVRLERPGHIENDPVIVLIGQDETRLAIHSRDAADQTIAAIEKFRDRLWPKE